MFDRLKINRHGKHSVFLKYDDKIMIISFINFGKEVQITSPKLKDVNRNECALFLTFEQQMSQSVVQE